MKSKPNDHLMTSSHAAPPPSQYSAVAAPLSIFLGGSTIPRHAKRAHFRYHTWKVVTTVCAELEELPFSRQNLNAATRMHLVNLFLPRALYGIVIPLADKTIASQFAVRTGAKHPDKT
eukprot:4355677-Pleurochrysis_carterae.AAC.1